VVEHEGVRKERGFSLLASRGADLCQVRSGIRDKGREDPCSS